MKIGLLRWWWKGAGVKVHCQFLEFGEEMYYTIVREGDAPLTHCQLLTGTVKLGGEVDCTVNIRGENVRGLLRG
jgi:hypothetical protein